MQRGVPLVSERYPGQTRFQGKTQPAPKTTTLEPKRDLGHHSGGCWFGHRPVCTCGPQEATHPETTKPQWSVQMLHSATVTVKNRVHGSLLKSSSSYHLLPMDQSPPVGMGSSQSAKYLYSRTHLKLNRDTLTCCCWLEAIAQFSQAIKDMIIQKWTYIQTIWTLLMLIITQILKKLSERSHMDLIF